MTVRLIQQLQQERHSNFSANAVKLVTGSNCYRDDPRIQVNLHRHSFQSRARARTINTQPIVKPEQRTMMRAHQDLRPIARNASGYKIELH
jgi:hypothetical protein